MDVVENLKAHGLVEHANLLQSYWKVIRDLRSVESSVIVGSIAKQKADRLSDIDIIIFASPEHLETVAAEMKAVPRVNIIYSWEKVFSAEHVFGKYIFENFVSIEIHVISNQSSFRLRRPFVALKGTEKDFESKIEPGEAPRHEDFVPLAGGSDGLAWEVFDIFKWCQRGHDDLARNHILKLSEVIRSQKA